MDTEFGDLERSERTWSTDGSWFAHAHSLEGVAWNVDRGGSLVGGVHLDEGIEESFAPKALGVEVDPDVSPRWTNGGGRLLAAAEAQFNEGGGLVGHWESMRGLSDG